MRRRSRSLAYVFNSIPTVKKRRSKFDLSHRLYTSMNVGKLYPVECIEILPGDTFKIKEAHVVRLSSAYIKPVMDNVFLDVYYFFVPGRLLFDDFEQVFGNASPSAYVDNELAEIPTIPAASNGFITVTSKSVADYLNLPLGTIPGGESILPFRAFAKIYNEWFRNENTVDEVYVHTGEAVASEALNSNPWSPTNYTGMLPDVGKLKDYFTSCLPQPQKGESVGIGTSVFPASTVPVGTGAINSPLPAGATAPMQFGGLGWQTSGYSSLFIQANAPTSSGSGVLRQGSVSSGNVGSNNPYPINLHAFIPDTPLSAIDVNDMRLAFALQKMLEEDARGGTRYREYILSHYGVSNGDARMQVPEFLGGKRTPLNVQQVAQTSQPTEQSALGSLAAFSHSVGRSKVIKSFTEHGYIIGVACIRQFHTYQQGVERHWSRLKREDMYDPKFANLGEQPVYTSQLFAKDQSSLKDDVFGYQEAWQEYRTLPNRITGEMRTEAENSFDVYHFGDYYQTKPVLTSEFTNETDQFFGRTVSVSPDNEDAFIVDMYFQIDAYRVLPTYSIPGLIDHH